MISQMYYLSTTHDNIEDLCYAKGTTVSDVWLPKRGNFLKQLKDTDEFLVTFIVLGNCIDKEDKEKLSIKAKSAAIQNIQSLTPSVMDEVVKADKSNLTNDIGKLLEWAFYNKFKSSLIYYLDKYPASRKYIGKLLFSYCDKSAYSELSLFLIKRYKYDITKDNHRLFEMAAMAKNACLCELLLDECDAKIPANVYNAFKNFGTKRFQYMWDVLKVYSDRVLLN